MKNKKRRPIVIMFRLNYLIIKQLILILLLVEVKDKTLYRPFRGRF